MSLKDKTLFITGASRGIGLAIALRAARDGANIAIAAKTTGPHPKLEGTIYTAAKQIEDAGGKALPLAADIRDEDAVKDAIGKTAAAFGGIDIVVNNASAISMTPVAQTEMKRFDLMHGINARGTFMVSKYAIPFLLNAKQPHILMISPPLDMQEKWFAPSTAYTMAKFGMSMVALGLAGELRGKRRGQRAVAAHHHRDGRDQKHSRRRQDDGDVAQARHPRRRGLAPVSERPGFQRELPDRRHLPRRRRRHRFRPLSRRPDASRCRSTSSCRTRRRRRKASPWGRNPEASFGLSE